MLQRIARDSAATDCARLASVFHRPARRYHRVAVFRCRSRRPLNYTRIYFTYDFSVHKRRLDVQYVRCAHHILSVPARIIRLCCYDFSCRQRRQFVPRVDGIRNGQHCYADLVVFIVCAIVSVRRLATARGFLACFTTDALLLATKACNVCRSLCARCATCVYPQSIYNYGLMIDDHRHTRRATFGACVW